MKRRRRPRRVVAGRQGSSSIPSLYSSAHFLPKDHIVTPYWSDYFSQSSFEDVLRIQAENRMWNKTLRLQAAALVDSRLAKQISREEYAMRRRAATEDAAECKRRGEILSDEIRRRALAEPVVASSN